MISRTLKMFILGLVAGSLVLTLSLVLMMPGGSAMAAPGDVIQTPTVPNEIPVEVENELGPASLKQAPLWKELFQLLQNPNGEIPCVSSPTGVCANIVRRPSFTVAPLPPLNLWPLDYNFLTAQPLRLRTSDGEVSWDNPGPMFDPAEDVLPTAFNVPTILRTPIGALVGSDDDVLDAGEVDGTTPCTTCGFLIVSNPGGSPLIPPDGTIVAVPAVVGGVLQALIPGTVNTEDVVDFEIPINEEDFFRPTTDTTGVSASLQPFIGRTGAEVLGKAFFWDMQVGSDGIQACGTCHFAAGVDSRTKNQLNPGHLGGDLTLQLHGPAANQAVMPGDFPFHKLANLAIPGEPMLNPGNVSSDTNDVMSSMGVVFRQFLDTPVGPGAFGPSYSGVVPLLPDIGSAVFDPIPVFQGLRRVEPRNTPTMHAAAFNFDNFWDGRARFHFNGGSVFGASDPFFHTFVDNSGVLEGASNGHFRPDLLVEDPAVAAQPVRIKFSSLASQAVGPPLSDFEMSFSGRNWAKIGKRLLQSGVTPLANQLVAVDDSVLGPFSNQGGTECANFVPARLTAVNKPGLCITYPEMIHLAFGSQFWSNTTQHLTGTAVPLTGFNPLTPDPAGPDPFDGYQLSIAAGPSVPANTNQFTQMEANMSLFFGLSVQAYEELLIPDDTPFDRFMDANPLAANATGEPGAQGVLYPTLVPGLVTGSDTGTITLIPDDPSTPEYDGFGPDEVFGFDIFSGSNLTAALPPGSPRNPIDPATGLAFGSNPFTRGARCMLCHLGPEQTDHSINISHGLLKGDAEFEFPTPPIVQNPNSPIDCMVDINGCLPAPEPTGIIAVVGGLILAEEVEETAQDAVEVEPRNFASVDDPSTPWDDRIVAQPGHFAFGDQGVYNIGLRPSAEDIGRGGPDPFGWPLSLSALTLKNIGGTAFEPCDGPTDVCPMTNFDPSINLAGGLFEETGGGLSFPGTTHTIQSINPGFERNPITPMLPEYLAHWAHGMPAGELHPNIDEMAGFAPNTITPPNGGPGIEFSEYMFGDDLHCGVYDPAVFGEGPPNFGWGALDPVTGDPVPGVCPNNQSGVAGNLAYPMQGSWPVPNRVLRNGAFKAPGLRNVEMTGPYFHTGSYLTLRQVVDFYMRGGDFPITNKEDRDPHMVDITKQAFGFGRTISIGGDLDLFADALPDTQYRYNVMPDTAHATPEYATQEDAKTALVHYLIALTDPRVKYERAPFDRPEIFVPLNGTAPDNTFGRAGFLANLANGMFKQVLAVGASGHATPLPNFLGISSIKGSPGNDHFDSVTVTATFSISGTVRTTASGRSGTPVAGVTMTLSGDANATTTTNASGVYTFAGQPNGNYTVTPSRAGFTFTPVNRAVTISNTNVTGRDFTATFTGGAMTFSISGTITSSGNPLAGVTVNLTGAANATTTTNASGVYTFTGRANGNYTVTPSLAGFTFTPVSRAVTINNANVTGQNFVGTAAAGGTFSISGTVRTPAFGRIGSPVPGVTMTLSGTASGTTATDANGNYIFTGLANGNYTVTPSQAGFTFTPVSRAVTISGANVTGRDFTRN